MEEFHKTGQKKHTIEKVTGQFLYEWAVMWDRQIVCLCPEEVWAQQVGEALDGYTPYMINEDGKSVPNRSLLEVNIDILNQPNAEDMRQLEKALNDYQWAVNRKFDVVSSIIKKE